MADQQDQEARFALDISDGDKSVLVIHHDEFSAIRRQADSYIGDIHGSLSDLENPVLTLVDYEKGEVAQWTPEKAWALTWASNPISRMVLTSKRVSA